MADNPRKTAAAAVPLPKGLRPLSPITLGAQHATDPVALALGAYSSGNARRPSSNTITQHHRIHPHHPADDSPGGTASPMSGGAASPLTRASMTRTLSTVASNMAAFANRKRLTKIVCTLGPAVASDDKVRDLLKAGMSVARLNFSHGSHEYHSATVERVRRVSAELGMLCSIMLDTKGPEIRTGKLKGGKNIQLRAGQTLELHCATVKSAQDDTFQGDNQRIRVDYANLPKVVEKGRIIKIDDGLIVCTVLDIRGNVVEVKVQNNAELGQNKGVNLPGTVVDLPPLTARDKADLAWGVRTGVDFVAASFTRKAADVNAIRHVLLDAARAQPSGASDEAAAEERAARIKIICKIENREGLDNFDDILKVADGIMVARGDLGVEIPIQQVVMAQKSMISKCNLAGKPVITATQMLESMVENPRPTRAEAGDVANAVFDGTDCVMLSGETAKGDYPVESVTVMARICKATEIAVDYAAVMEGLVACTSKPLPLAETITSAAVRASMDRPVKAIMALTVSGSSARFVSKYRPSVPVIVVTPDQRTARQALVSRALYPVCAKFEGVVTPQMNDYFYMHGIIFGKEMEFFQKGDEVVLVSGLGSKGSTNTMQILCVP